MDRYSDLILDSKLDTRFDPEFTVHVYSQVSTDSDRRRGFQREEYWRRVSKIGSGAYGSVWLEKCVQGHQNVEERAVKEVLTKISKNARQIDYSRELEAIAKFSHARYVRCFVKSFGWYEAEEKLFIAMEYLRGGDLEQYLFENPPLTEEAAADITYQVSEGLSYMHENRFAHRDLKPGNILIKSLPPRQWWVKIGDFGISKRYEAEIFNSTLLKGTRGFIAPELYKLTSAGTPYAADMWALGEIAFQLLTKQAVFENIGLFVRYAEQSYAFPSENLATCHVSNLGQDFISSLMVASPGMRLTAEAALKHPWITFYSPSVVQPSPTLQMTSTLPVTDSITGAFASWNSIPTPDSPSLDLAETIRPNRSKSSQPPYHQNLRPLALRDVQEGNILNVKEKYYLGELSGHDEEVMSVAFSPDGVTIASGAKDASVKIWDLATGKQLRTISGHSGVVWSVKFSPDSTTIASGSADTTIRIWDAASGRQLQKLYGHSKHVWSVAFSPDGTTIASGSADTTVRIWDAASGWQIRELNGHSEHVWSVAFSPDGTTIASGSTDTSIRIWDAASGRQLRELSGHTYSVRCIAFSPDGTIIASGSEDWLIKIWDASTGNKLRELREHTGAIRSLAFSPDGAAIVSSSVDWSVRIWDVGTGKQLREPRKHSDWVQTVAFSPDGATIAFGSSCGFLRICDAGTQ